LIFILSTTVSSIYQAWNFVGKLRKFDAKTPILFYSGSAYDLEKEFALSNGAQGFLTKPVDTQLLVNEVFRLISSSEPAGKLEMQTFNTRI